MPVGNTSRRPPLKQMAPAGHPRRFHHTPILSCPRAYKKDQSSLFSDAGDDSASPAEMRGRLVQRNDMYALPYAEDVTRIHGIPVGSLVAKMRLGREQQLERYIRWGRGLSEEFVRLVAV